MELDEFKTYWNMQEREIEKEKLTIEKLDSIIMKATTTLGEIQAKNVYWRKLGTFTCSMLVVIMLFYLGIQYFVTKQNQTFGQSVILVAIIIVFGLVSIWVYKKQEKIFELNPNENLREALKKTITNFKRFYVLFNVIYLFLFPAYYYAAIKLLNVFLPLSSNIIWLISGALTLISFVGNHWYYSIHYLKRIKILEENLDELSS